MQFIPAPKIIFVLYSLLFHIIYIIYIKYNKIYIIYIYILLCIFNYIKFQESIYCLISIVPRDYTYIQ